jgi:hypothetical protein
MWASDRVSSRLKWHAKRSWVQRVHVVHAGTSAMYVWGHARTDVSAGEWVPVAASTTTSNLQAPSLREGATPAAGDTTAYPQP